VAKSRQKYHNNKRLKVGAIIGLVGMLFITLTLLFKLNLNNQELSITKNRAEALNVFLMKDLKDKLKPIGRLDLLEMISQQIIQYYSVQPESTFTVTSYNHLVDALNTMGEVKIRSGELDQAQALLSESDGYVNKSLMLDKANIQTLFQSSQNQYWMGYIHYLNKDWVKTQTYWTNYLQLTIQMEQLEPDNLTWQLEHSYALNNLGTISLNLKQNELAQNYLNESAQIKTSLVEKAPNNRQYVAELADTISWLANLAGDENQLVKANQYHQQSLALSQKLLEVDANNSNWDYRLALAYYRLGRSDYDLGDLAAAALNIQQSIDIMDGLLLIDQSNHKWLGTLINNHIVMAKLNHHQNNIDQALWHVEQGKYYYHQYSPQNKQLTTTANQLLKLNTVSSLIMNDLGQTKAALTQYQKAYDQFLHNSNPDQIPVFTTAYHLFIMSELSHSDAAPSKSQVFLDLARETLVTELASGSQNKEIKALYLMIIAADNSDEFTAQLQTDIEQMQYRNPDLFNQEKYR
jgi:tetratricopeptide (TPR) repeat protein